MSDSMFVKWGLAITLMLIVTVGVFQFSNDFQLTLEDVVDAGTVEFDGKVLNAGRLSVRVPEAQGWWENLTEEDRLEAKAILIFGLEMATLFFLLVVATFALAGSFVIFIFFVGLASLAFAIRGF